MNFAKGRPEPVGNLRAEPGLGPDRLAQIDQLAADCVAADGGRLKLERRVLQTRPADQVNDFMWFDEDVLVGFLGIYGYRPDQVELCGMVHPSSRRQGIFSRLFEAAIAEVRLRGVPEALLVVDRLYEGGTAFARHLGAEIEHSEHRMVWRREPAEFTPDPSVKMREATRSDIAFIIKCLTEAFDFPAEALEAEEEDTLARRYPGTYVIERAGELVGTIRVERDGRSADIYGFAVSPPFQGQGIGRQVLSGLARDLGAEGTERVGLEVSCTNDSALGLYLSCGFEVTGTEDYYAVNLPQP